jgi:hypothetical protein
MIYVLLEESETNTKKPDVYLNRDEQICKSRRWTEMQICRLLRPTDMPSNCSSSRGRWRWDGVAAISCWWRSRPYLVAAVRWWRSYRIDGGGEELVFGTRLEGNGVETAREGAVPCSHAETPGREVDVARVEERSTRRREAGATREEAGRYKGISDAEEGWNEAPQCGVVSLGNWSPVSSPWHLIFLFLR